MFDIPLWLVLKNAIEWFIQFLNAYPVLLPALILPVYFCFWLCGRGSSAQAWGISLSVPGLIGLAVFVYQLKLPYSMPKLQPLVLFLLIFVPVLWAAPAVFLFHSWRAIRGNWTRMTLGSWLGILFLIGTYLWWFYLGSLDL